MLVLTRKTGDTISIDGGIKIQIVQVKGKQVRVGIDAPKDKKVQRGELLAALPRPISRKFFLESAPESPLS